MKGIGMRRLLILGSVLALTGCATPEDRLRDGLIHVGLSQRVSACMASKMVHELSLPELQKIGSLGSLSSRPLGELSIDELFYRVRALRDEHILSVTTRAGLSCAVDSAR